MRDTLCTNDYFEAAIKLRYIPQPTPTSEPTMMRCCTGTTVKLSSDTKGHSFRPALVTGQKSWIPYIPQSAYLRYGFFGMRGICRRIR